MLDGDIQEGIGGRHLDAPQGQLPIADGWEAVLGSLSGDDACQCHHDDHTSLSSRLQAAHPAGEGANHQGFATLSSHCLTCRILLATGYIKPAWHDKAVPQQAPW